MGNNSRKNQFGLNPKNVALSHCRRFAKNIKYHVKHDYFDEAFKTALAENELSLLVEGSDVKIISIEKPKPPTYEFLMKFYAENRPQEET